MSSNGLLQKLEINQIFYNEFRPSVKTNRGNDQMNKNKNESNKYGFLKLYYIFKYENL
jgi:hypothetical protein